MATDMKRFSISIPVEMEQQLRQLKEAQFQESTQSEMLRFLIEKGLQAIRAQ